MFRKMRRKDLEIRNPLEIEDIINSAQVVHIGLSGEEYPYVVPMTYGYEKQKLYLHCASQGHRIDLIRRDPRVCFQLECDVVFHPDDSKSSGLTLTYRSVTGFGIARILEELDEKRDAIRILASHYCEKGTTVHRSEQALRNVTMLEISIQHMTGKEHRMNSPFSGWDNNINPV